MGKRQILLTFLMVRFRPLMMRNKHSFVFILVVVDAECIEDTPQDPEEETENNDESQYKVNKLLFFI